MTQQRLRSTSATGNQSALIFLARDHSESKDDIDIDAILSFSQLDLPTALAAAQAIDGPAFSPHSTLKAPYLL